jgi:hypothetical protein
MLKTGDGGNTAELRGGSGGGSGWEEWTESEYSGGGRWRTVRVRSRRWTMVR